MATSAIKKQCVVCGQEKVTYKCEGCSKDFCVKDLSEHHQTLDKQLGEIEHDRNLFLETLIQYRENKIEHPLIEQINKWENDSINKIKQTAEESRQILIEFKKKFITEMENNLVNLTEQIKQTREDSGFNEIDLNHLKEKLIKLKNELDETPNVLIEEQSTLFINKISVITSSEQPQIITSKANLVYSDKKLDCKGHACEKCGECRDWYWHPDGSYKVYTKRDDATCIYNYVGNITACITGRYYHGFGIGFDRLCQCVDNRS